MSLWTQWTEVLNKQVKKKNTTNLQAHEFTFVSGHRLEKAEGNVRRTTNHGFKFITTEERQKWHWDHFCHSFSDCSHLFIKLMKSERSSNATHKANTLCETSCFYGNYWLNEIFCIFKFFPATTQRNSFPLGIKWPRDETEHLLLPSSEVKNEWSFTSSRPKYFMVCKGTIILTSQQINIYLSLTLTVEDSAPYIFICFYDSCDKLLIFITALTNHVFVTKKLCVFTFMWPCTITNFFIIRPTRWTNFTNLFCYETLHVSDSSSVHHQEFIHCTLSNGICRRGL